MGKLSLLQGILATEESNQGLLCGRWILYTSLRFIELCTHMVPMSVLVSDTIVLCAHTETLLSKIRHSNRHNRDKLLV